MSELQEEITARYNADSIRDTLKTNPANKIALWNTLKTMSFTRLSVAVYASALMSAFSSVQFNILTGLLAADEVGV